MESKLCCGFETARGMSHRARNTAFMLAKRHSNMTQLMASNHFLSRVWVVRTQLNRGGSLAVQQTAFPNGWPFPCSKQHVFKATNSLNLWTDCCFESDSLQWNQCTTQPMQCYSHWNCERNRQLFDYLLCTNAQSTEHKSKWHANQLQSFLFSISKDLILIWIRYELDMNLLSIRKDGFETSLHEKIEVDFSVDLKFILSRVDESLFKSDNIP